MENVKEIINKLEREVTDYLGLKIVDTTFISLRGSLICVIHTMKRGWR
jgi:hypothetical protein